MSVALRLGWPTGPGAPFWQTPCAHLWRAHAMHRERTEAEHRDAWHRAVYAACVVRDGIPRLSDKAPPSPTPEDFLPWLREEAPEGSPEALTDAERLALATARIEEQDARERAKAAREATETDTPETDTPDPLPLK